nr:unnamed protein product [Callosobruchus chinensis]
MLQVRKEYSCLTKAFSIVIDVCKAAEKLYPFFLWMSVCQQSSMVLLITSTMCNIPIQVYDGHATILIKLIPEKYFSLRIHHECMKNLDTKTMRVRLSLTKIIHFKNQ